ncbi:hypothetical protein CCICO_04415 [Corynebacterium ciconiae DSM 44920]|uniref:hypothetical protein n=1 Tax=Corynebacterium ciconiae TaxID=227319 RepID=UPI002647DE6A|nr:hypothetical protein [Corynebacterium ciconiae]WKD60920.1 hypothetical protein CCICO_04415 [Corynebacterium ciconiae DSM 44920]
MSKLPDVLRTVIEFLSGALPDYWVGDSLPPGQELAASLPCVIVDLLPGTELRVSWGGADFPVRVDGAAIDIEVFAASRGQATPVAEQVRLLMHQLPFVEGSRIVSVECPSFGTREDLNPRVKVLGGVAELALHT